VAPMKKLNFIYIIIIFLGVVGCTSASENEQSKISPENTALGSTPAIEFDTTVNNLGTIVEGEQVLTYFKYQNTGDAPLVIYSIKAGCGCTVPKWNEKPLNPGDKDGIKVIFNSSGKSGNSNIRITVNSNANNATNTLYIKAEVN